MPYKFTQEISFSKYLDDMLSDEYANWSRSGAAMLWDWFNDNEIDLPGWTDEEGKFIFDRVAMRCQFQEYNSALEAAQYYCGQDIKDEDSALDYFLSNTAVIRCDDGGIIFQEF